MTSLPGLGTLPGVDHRHARHVGTTGDTMTGLPAVSLPGVDHRHARHVGTTGGTMTSLPSCPASIVGTTGTAAARCQVDDRDMTSLPDSARLPASIVGTTGTAARCQVDDRDNDQLARRQLPAVDHRHHGHGRGGGPDACQVDDQLARVSFPLELAGVDHRHGHGRGKARRLPGR